VLVDSGHRRPRFKAEKESCRAGFLRTSGRPAVGGEVVRAGFGGICMRRRQSFGRILARTFFKDAGEIGRVTGGWIPRSPSLPPSASTKHHAFAQHPVDAGADRAAVVSRSGRVDHAQGDPRRRSFSGRSAGYACVDGSSSRAAVRLSPKMRIVFGSAANAERFPTKHTNTRKEEPGTNCGNFHRLAFVFSVFRGLLLIPS